jgi:stage V sporulation protein B
MKKDTLIKGTLILAIAALVARFLGLVQRVPLQNYLDDYGMALYGISYNIYFALLIVATAGIPSALSKLVADRLALGKQTEATIIYRAAVHFAIIAGLLMTVLLYVLAPYYATYVAHVPESALAIRALAPALLLFPLIAIMRGYFQGRQNMTAGGVSQMIEQILRVITAVLFVAILVYWGYSVETAAAGAAFGGVMGSIGAFLVMLYFWLRLRRQERAEHTVESSSSQQTSVALSKREVYRQIFRLSIPISIVSIIVPAIYFIDSSIVVPLIKEQVAGGIREAQEILGVLVGRAQSFAGIPPILAIALSTSIVPIISAAYAKQDQVRLNQQSSLALRLSLLAGLPLVVMLIVAARSYNVFLFGDDRGTWIIIALTATAIFQIIMMTSGAILMGLGMIKAPMVHVGYGIAIKLIGSYLLSIWFGVYGIIAATGIAFFIILVLNLRVLRKHIQYQVLGARWLSLLVTTVLLLGVGLLFETYVYDWLDMAWLTALTSSLLLGLLYPLLLAFTGVFRHADLTSLPVRLQTILTKIKFDQLLRR